MKNILTTILLFISFTIFSQDYPIQSKDSNGVDIIIFTIDQANQINKKIQLIPYYEEMSGLIGEFDTTCTDIIKTQNNYIKSLKEQSNLKDNLILIKDSQVSNLNEQIKNLNLDRTYCEKQKDDLNSIIKIKDKKILKWKIISGSTFVVLVVSIFFLI